MRRGNKRREERMGEMERERREEDETKCKRRRMRGKVEESKGSRKEMGEIAKGEAGGREGEENTSKTISLQVAPESKELYPIERFTSRSISISPLLPLYLQSCQSSG